MEHGHEHERQTYPTINLALEALRLKTDYFAAKSEVYEKRNNPVVFDRWLKKSIPQTVLLVAGEKTPSFTSLIGGKFLIPEADMYEFLDLYFEATQVLHWKSGLVEIAQSEKVHLYFDVDLEIEEEFIGADKHAWATDLAAKVSKIAWETASELLRDSIDNSNELEMICAVCDPRPGKIATKFKVGMHMQFTQLVTTMRSCRAIIAAIRSNLNQLDRESSISGVPVWLIANAFDPIPYRKGTGLRLMGSNKLSMCNCGSGCGKCNGHHYIEIPNSAYYPRIQIDCHGEVKSNEKFRMSGCLHAMRLFVTDSEEDHLHEAPEHLLENDDFREEFEKVLPSSQKKKRTITAMQSACEKQLISIDHFILPDNLFAQLEEGLGILFNLPPKKLRQMTLKWNFLDKTDWFILCSSLGKYCVHKKTEHASNHVWFIVSPKGVRQRCHDEACIEYYKTRTTKSTEVNDSKILPAGLTRDIDKFVLDTIDAWAITTSKEWFGE